MMVYQWKDLLFEGFELRVIFSQPPLSGHAYPLLDLNHIPIKGAWRQ
jgi:hypothetical protein